MDAGPIKNSLKILKKAIEVPFDATGWYWCDNPPVRSVMPKANRWVCIFLYYKLLKKGRTICFSKDQAGCSGNSCYLGFVKPAPAAGGFLAEKEKFKQTVALGQAFYRDIQAPEAKNRHIAWAQIESIEDKEEVEVINLWINPMILSDLLTLSNYDRPENDNVITPFAAGCQSVWTYPYKENDAAAPKCVIGSLDPAMRKYIPDQVISFSMPAGRFVEMCNNIPGSFLD